MLFREQVYALATQALESLVLSQESGRVPNNPLSESHFFSVWVSKSLKEKSFGVCMAPLLKHWQQCARTQGAGANLKNEFQSIKNTYETIEHTGHVVTKEKIENVFECLNANDWQINIEPSINKKCSIKKEKSSSIVLDDSKKACVFDESNELKSVFSVFVRGDQQYFVDKAHQQGLLVYKVTDYKSLVKFHGEFLFAPKNNFNLIAQFVSQR